MGVTDCDREGGGRNIKEESQSSSRFRKKTTQIEPERKKRGLESLHLEQVSNDGKVKGGEGGEKNGNKKNRPIIEGFIA